MYHRARCLFALQVHSSTGKDIRHSGVTSDIQMFYFLWKEYTYNILFVA